MPEHGERAAHVIRPATPDDAEGIAAVRAAALPHHVASAAATRHRMADPAVSGTWVALVGDQVAGHALARRPQETGGWVAVVVAPHATRRGVGSALLRVVEERVRADGGGRVSTVADGLAARAFAVARGYEVGDEHRFAAAELATAPAPPEPPTGVELLALAEVDPHDVWVLHGVTIADDPSGMSIAQPYERWSEDLWSAPDHAADLGAAALVDGELVAFTQVLADRARGTMWSAMTGVAPGHRGRGLARLVKASAFASARAAGITRAYTANAAVNAPMLAVNDWLGYRPAAVGWTVTRSLDGSALPD